MWEETYIISNDLRGGEERERESGVVGIFYYLSLLLLLSSIS